MGANSHQNKRRSYHCRHQRQNKVCSSPETSGYTQQPNSDLTPWHKPARLNTQKPSYLTCIYGMAKWVNLLCWQVPRAAKQNKQDQRRRGKLAQERTIARLINANLSMQAQGQLRTILAKQHLKIAKSPAHNKKLKRHYRCG